MIRKFVYVYRRRQKKFHYKIRRLQIYNNNTQDPKYTIDSLKQKVEHPIIFAIIL